jgi:predicted TIM-barrel fold metal-dependent hydrolase
MTRALIISSDGHAALPLEQYRPYLDKKYHRDFDELLESKSRLSVDFFEIVDPKVSAPYKAAMFDTGVIESKWNLERRLKETQLHGIAAEVLFADSAPFGAGGIGSAREQFGAELELAGARAYNRWIAEWVSAHPDRYAAQSIVTFSDVDAAVEDVYWAKEHGIRGITVPGMERGIPLYWDPVYNPFWTACEETGLPINFHAGVGHTDYGGANIPGVPYSVRMRVSQFESRWFSHRPLWFLIWSGVLERHPGLKVIFTETHSDWITEVIAKMDHSYDHSMLDDAVKDVVKHRPSEYWSRQCYLGASLLSRVEAAHHREIGTQSMMFGADFPHPEGTWKSTLTYLQATLGSAGVDEASARAILGENAAAVFGFDLQALRPVADEVGFEIEDILTPVDPALEPSFDRTDIVRPGLTMAYAGSDGRAVKH